MKANPFLSNQDIFAKAPRKISVHDQPTGVVAARQQFQGYSMNGTGLSGNMSSFGLASNPNQSSQLSLGARIGSQPTMSPLSTNLSDFESASSNDYGNHAPTHKQNFLNNR